MGRRINPSRMENIIKAIPNMIVLNPVDAIETKKMVAALASYKGPAYIRVNRNDLPVYTPQDQAFEIGKMHTIREGTDIAIFATGAMVWKSMEAAEKLADEGISVEVINVSTLKPLKKEEILDHLDGKKGIISAEEASRIGGLGERDRGAYFWRSLPALQTDRHRRFLWYFRL